MRAQIIQLTIIIALVLLSAGMSHAHNKGYIAHAIPLSGITIDGRLDDWPEKMAIYKIECNTGYYKTEPPDGPEDLSASFRVGYDTAAGVVYIAVVVRDEELVVHPENPAGNTQDLCEVYIDGDHSGNDDCRTMSGAHQYTLVPGPGFLYPNFQNNPNILGDSLGVEIEKSGVKVAYLRAADFTTYEWAIPIFEHFPDRKLQIEPGKTIGFEVVVIDADGTELSNWIPWSPEASKYFNSNLYGDLVFVKDYNALNVILEPVIPEVLQKSYTKLGSIEGKVTHQQDGSPWPQAVVCLEDNLGKPQGTVKTDAYGRYHLWAVPGIYRISVADTRGAEPVSVTVKHGQHSKNINFAPERFWNEKTASLIEELKTQALSIDNKYFLKPVPNTNQFYTLHYKVTVPNIIELLNDEDPRVRNLAVKVLGSFNINIEGIISALIKAINDNDPGVRNSAAEIVAKIGPEAKKAVPVLIEMLNDKDRDVQLSAVEILGKIGPEAKSAIPALIQQKDGFGGDIEVNAVRAIGGVPKELIPKILEDLKNVDVRTRYKAVNTLGFVISNKKDVVIPIIKMLEDKEWVVRMVAAMALEEIGNEARNAVPALIKALDDPIDQVQGAAIRALGAIGPDAKAAVPILIERLKDNTLPPLARPVIAEALGKMGTEAQVALLALNELLRDNDETVRKNASIAITSIADSLFTRMNDLKSSDIKDALQYFTSAAHEFALDDSLAGVQKERLNDLSGAIRGLKAEYDSRPLVHLFGWIEKYELTRKPWAWAIFIYLLIIITCLAAWFLFLWKRPLWLYKLNKKLRHPEIIPEWLGISIGFRQILLLSFFNYNRRVLDAWVRDTFEKARSQFENLQTIQERKIYVPMPVTIDGRTVDQPATEDFNGIFTKERFCLLIWGEGGSGKTSLACRLARWAMNEDVEKPLSGHLMLPVLIEHDLHETLREQKHPFLQAIHSQVELITGDDEIEPEFMRHLLKKQRILVIVDRLSEMNAETRKLVQLGYDPELKINALISTSRTKESMHGALINTVEPLRIDKEHLLPFMVSYLKHENLEDSDYFDACSHLSKISGTRGITALMAKLYAEQLITIKKEVTSLEDLPDTIPDLMLGYLNWINRNKTGKDPDHRTIHRISKVVAWASMKDTFKPSDASISVVQSELPDEKNIDEKLAYMSEKLGLIRFVGHSLNRFRITLDPLAEYLAGLHLLELYRSDEKKWRQFLDEIDKKDVDIEAIEDFLLAVLDCCQSEGKEYGVPGFVEAELSGRIFPVQMAV